MSARKFDEFIAKAHCHGKKQELNKRSHKCGKLGRDDNIDKAAEKDKGEKITVSLPDEYADQKDEIKTLIEAALAEYEGIKIK